METNNENRTMTSAHVEGVGDDVSYGAVSTLAIAAVLIGLVSPLSWIAPLLWGVPVGGLAVAALALRRIAASDGALVGRGAALVGVALCVLSLTAAASRALVERQLLASQARAAAAEWIEWLQQGRALRAFDMTLESQRPPPGDPAAGGHGHDHDHDHDHAADPFEEFLHRPAVEFLTTGGRDAAVEFHRQLSWSREPSDEVVVDLELVVDRSESATAARPTLRLKMVKTRPSRAAEPRWMVAQYEGERLPAGDAAPR